MFFLPLLYKQKSCERDKPRRHKQDRADDFPKCMVGHPCLLNFRTTPMIKIAVACTKCAGTSHGLKLLFQLCTNIRKHYSHLLRAQKSARRHHGPAYYDATAGSIDIRIYERDLRACHATLLTQWHRTSPKRCVASTPAFPGQGIFHTQLASE